MTIASYFFDLYESEPAYFQRMVEFFLHARFKAVRPFLEGKEREESVFFTVEGELVNIRDNRRRHATFTDWYNAAFRTHYDRENVEVFRKIFVTRRVTLMDILMTVGPKERDEFLDCKYLSSLAYGYIQRRMRAKFIAFKWDKKQTVTVEWSGRKYYVSHTNTTTDMGFSVVRFLHTICGEESAIHGLYCILEDGSKVLLNEEREETVGAAGAAGTVGTVGLIGSTPELPTSPTPPPVESPAFESLKKQMEDVQTHVKMLHTDLRILAPLQIADREKNAKEVEDLRTKNAMLAAELEAVKAHQAVLFTHYQHLSGIIGQLMQRTGMYYVPQAAGTY